jgi:heat-inducible transcriptional repressor
MTPTHEARKKYVLSLIVELHIAQAAPVSSRVVADRMEADVSSATIRNIMVELEADGLIMHPHTSAGRVPTERGYRYYVDVLMPAAILTAAERAQVDDLFDRTYYAFGELLDRVSHILARMSEHVAIGMAPDVRHGALKQFEMVSMGDGKFLGVLRTTDGFVYSHMIDMHDELQPEEVVGLLRFINAELGGLALAHIDEVLIRRQLAQRDAFFYILRRAQEVLQSSLRDMVEARIYYDGIGNLFSQPEFRDDMSQMQALVRTFEAPEELLDVMESHNAQTGTHVTIGHEHPHSALGGCAVVSCSYGIGQDVLGRIAIIGPTRMCYPKAMALVEYLGDQITVHLEQEA